MQVEAGGANPAAIPLKPMTLPQDAHVTVVLNRSQLQEAMEQIVGGGRDPLYPIVGLDIEWRPTFVKGEHTIPALMQVCLPTRDIFIFQLQRLLPWMHLLEPLVNSEEIYKCGFGIASDARLLRELHLFHPAGFVDVGRISLYENNINNNNDGPAPRRHPQIGMKEAVQTLFEGYTLKKSQQMTNWERFPLTPAQLNYAALDAFVSMEVALELQHRGAHLVPTEIGPVKNPCAECGKESFQQDAGDRQWYCHLCFEAWYKAQQQQNAPRRREQNLF